MNIGLLRTLSLAGAVILGSTAAQAALVPVPVYSSFAAHEKFDQVNGNVVTGPRSSWGSAFTEAAAFIPTLSNKLDYIDVALSTGNTYFGGGGYIGALVSITTDSGGNPDATLETWVVTKLQEYSGGGLPVLKATKLTSLRKPSLVAGTQYWIVVQPLGLDTLSIWSTNSISAPGAPMYSLDGGSTWTGSGASQYAFDVWEE